MYILIPPSERKLETPTGRNDGPLPESIARDTKAALAKFRRKSRAELQRIYNVRTPEIARSFHVRNERYDKMPTLKAIERYRGVMYDAIAYADLPEPRVAEERLVIVSAFFGAIRGGTPIPDYKLPMHSWLAKFWQPINTQRLHDLAHGEIVLNLLPQAHQRAVDYHPQRVVDFRAEGGRRSSGHFGKTVRGQFVRWLLENEIHDPADFGGFSEDGYRFDGENFVQD